MSAAAEIGQERGHTFLAVVVDVLARNGRTFPADPQALLANGVEVRVIYRPREKQISPRRRLGRRFPQRVVHLGANVRVYGVGLATTDVTTKQRAEGCSRRNRRRVHTPRVRSHDVVVGRKTIECR